MPKANSVILKEKLMRHQIAILYLSGFGREDLIRCGFSYRIIMDTIKDTDFLEAVGNILLDKVYVLGLFSKIYGLNEVLPLPYLYITLDKIYNQNTLITPDFLPEIKQISYVCSGAPQISFDNPECINLKGIKINKIDYKSNEDKNIQKKFYRVLIRRKAYAKRIRQKRANVAARKQRREARRIKEKTLPCSIKRPIKRRRNTAHRKIEE